VFSMDDGCILMEEAWLWLCGYDTQVPVQAKPFVFFLCLPLNMTGAILSKL
jgi:hypothetical protein